MHHLFAELRRRKVHRAALLYLVGGIATVEAAELVFPRLQLPDWSVTLVLAVVIVGFPLAMAVAWIFETTTGGLVRTPKADGAAPAESQPPSGSVTPRDDAERPSVLVAPFTNGSPDPDNDYISDGLTEEIITDLSKIKSLRVISRSSAMRLRDSPKPLVATARELGVDYVLEGSVRKAGDDLRITVQLVEVSSDQTRWSERYRGTFDDIFGIQEQVARSVAQELADHITPDEMETLTDREIDDPRAFESYLRARYETWRFSRVGLENAERHLKNGLELIGDSALLYTSLGHVYTWYAQLGLDADGTYLRQAEGCVEKVFTLEPDSSRGYWLRGVVRFQAGELRSARAPLERALEGRPEDPDTLMMLGYLCALSGQHSRATGLFERALEVDPLTPLNHAMAMGGFIAILEGRPEDAVEAYRTYRDMDPGSPFATFCWLWVLLWNGRVTDAEPVVAALAERHSDSLFAPLGSALFHGVRGDSPSALRAITDPLRRAAETNELFSRELAHCLALGGRPQEALDWLENTIRIGNVNYLYWSRHDTWLESIRSEPRYAQLMSQVEREWMSLNPQLATS